MDDQAAILARRVAQAASAWLTEPRDLRAYRNLVEAVGAWDAYAAPVLDEGEDEDLADSAAEDPPTLGDGVDELAHALRRQARKML